MMVARTTSTWRTRRLGDLLAYEQPGSYLVRSTNYVSRGRYPVLTAGKTFVLGYTNEADGAYTKHPVIVFDDFTTASKYVDFDFKAKSSAMKMLTARYGEADLRFIYERMQLIDYPIVDHKRRWIAEFSKIEVDVPELAEQKTIAEVAGDMSTYIAALERMIAKRQAIKQGMMQELLTGRTRLPGFSEPWREATLSELVEQHRAALDPHHHPETRFQHFSLPAFDDGETPVLETGSSIDSQKFHVPSGAVLVSKLNPRIPRIWVTRDVHVNAIASTEFIVLAAKDRMHRAYLGWLMKSQLIAGRMKLLAVGTTGSHARIHPRQVLAFDCAVPEPGEQKAIASTLDDMEAQLGLMRIRLGKAKAIKEGMMQQLLTGRTRLPVQEGAV